jgi:hypothetical protein
MDACDYLASPGPVANEDIGMRNGTGRVGGKEPLRPVLALFPAGNGGKMGT